MKQILRIQIEARWPTSAKTAWVLLAANGARLSEGVSEAAHWPLADEYEVVLGAPQATWHAVQVPLGKTARSEMPRLLAYALSASGSDWKTWHVRDTTTGADLPAGILTSGWERRTS